MIHLAVADDGTVFHEIARDNIEANHLVWIDREGNRSSACDESRRFGMIQLSPSGDRAITNVMEKDGRRNLWICETDRKVLVPVTTGEQNYETPLWTPDGQSIVAIRSSQKSRGAEIVKLAADGSGREDRIATLETIWVDPTAVSPDGKWLVATIWDPETDNDWDIILYPMDGGEEPVLFAEEPTNEEIARFSPDGRWMVYQSNRSGRDEIWLRRFPDGDGLTQVSTGGGISPLWNPDGTELFYVRSEDEMLVSVDVELGEGVRLGGEQELFQLEDTTWNLSKRLPYEVTSDGERFIAVMGEGRKADDSVGVILNWFDELERLAPTSR